MDPKDSSSPEELIQELNEIIAGQKTNTDHEQIMTRWVIGEKIRKAIIYITDAVKGLRIISSLADKLQHDFGDMYDETNLRLNILFADTFPDMGFVSDLPDHVKWSHIKTIIQQEDDLKRTYLTEMCAQEKWSHEELLKHLDDKLPGEE